MIDDDHHVEDIVSERVLAVGIGAVIDEVIVDVFVAEARRERQRVLAVIRVACSRAQHTTVFRTVIPAKNTLKYAHFPRTKNTLHVSK